MLAPRSQTRRSLGCQLTIRALRRLKRQIIVGLTRCSLDNKVILRGEYALRPELEDGVSEQARTKSVGHVLGSR